ncbi:MAG: methyl-accepting chemotaxis protein [Candidatus Thiodiazotropha sp. 6PLUC3]
MLRSIGISARFVYATVFAVLVVLAITLFTTFNFMGGILSASEENEISEIFENVVSGIESEGRLARAMSALVAGVPDVQEAFSNKDRQALSDLFAPGFAKLKKEYGVRQFQFHEPPATSFLRVHKPAKFGDDLSGFRLTVVEGNREKNPIQGLEVGVAGLGIRGLVPVSHQGKHIGTVEFGMSFGQAFFDEYAKHHDVDLELYIDRKGVMDRFASTMEGNNLISSDEFSAILGGESHYGRGELNSKPVAFYAANISNYSGDPIGILIVAKDRSEAANAISSLTWMLFALGLGSVIVIGFLVWVISGGVVKPICVAAKAMEGIASADGDLTVRMDESGEDEISRLSKAYNRFAEKIEGMVKSVSNSAGNLSVQIGEFANLAEHTNSGIRQQHEQTAQVATAMTQMSATVHEVAHNTTQTAEAAREADVQANSGRTVVMDVTNSIDRLATDVGKAVETVQHVAEDSERIGSVLDVIRGIADQTNLLALNAAIEAARAGEQGRGFAVVADEVRTLAKRTQDSTEEIQEMIESLQSGVHKTVAVMETSQHQAAESVEQAGRAHASLEEINQVIDSISGMSAQIATAAEEQSAVAEDINRNIIEITQIADETYKDSDKSYQASTEMSDEVDKLSHLLDQFNIGDTHGKHLQQAMLAHLSWKTKLRSFLDGKGALDERVAFDHTQCGFGKWYDAHGRTDLGHISEIREIEKPHKELHELIKTIAELKKRGDLAGAEREYQRVGPMSENIVALMGSIKSKL